MLYINMVPAAGGWHVPLAIDILAIDKVFNKLRDMPHTALARIALCEAVADIYNNHHNNRFAQLVTFCDSIQAQVLDVGGMGAIPVINLIQLLAGRSALHCQSAGGVPL